MKKISKILVIVGPTASGKSELAMKIAKKFNGAIIAADSRTIYKGMDIGTAKPEKKDQDTIPHYLLDIINPDQYFSVVDFKRLAKHAIIEIQKNNKLPIIVGGTGLYIDSILYNYDFPPKVNIKIKRKLESKTNNELINLIKLQNPNLLDRLDVKNRRRLIRCAETINYRSGTKSAKIYPKALLIGIRLTKSQLEKRIKKRLNHMFNAGIIQEVREVGGKYGWGNESTTAIGYDSIRKFIDGKITLAEAKKEILTSNLKLIKKQNTWFKRNKDIIWIKNTRQAINIVQDFLL